MRFLRQWILSFLLIWTFHNPAWAVTEFTVSVNKTGQDYSLISTAVNALKCDLTTSATKVFSHSGIHGTIADASAVTGATSGATGTAVHVTSSQILIKTISGTFQNGEQVYKTQNVDYVVLTNAGDSAIVTVNLYDDNGDMDDRWDVTGYTTSTTNYVKITAPVGERHRGKYQTGSGNGASSVTSVNITSHARASVSYCELSWIQLSCSQSADYQGAGIDGFDTVHHIISRRTGSYSCGGINVAGNTGTTRYVYRNVLYNIGSTVTGIYMNFNTIYVYDNTVHGAGNGVYLYNYGLSCYLKNNILTNNSTDYNSAGGGLSASATNVTKDATSPDGASYQNQTVSFVDSANGDFHLASGDTAAKDRGTNLGSPYDSDIDAETVSGTWDIGADEYIAAATDVYSGRGMGRGIGRGIGR